MRDDDVDPAGRVSGIVLHRGEPAFVAKLRAAGAQFARPGFEQALARHLRANPGLVEAWESWSADQRWTPSAYVEGTEVGWYDAGRHHVRRHTDRAAAAADFIHRMSVWLAYERVVQ